MLRSIQHITGTTIQATDGRIGEVTEAYFDDERWAIRYLIVDTGSWLAERKVLISPYSIRQPLVPGENISVHLNREQVKNSPDIDTHMPVSRRHERQYLGYYAYPDYWEGGQLWAMGGFPVLAPVGLTPPEVRLAMDEEQQVAPEDVHLRSSDNVTGYDIEASDGSIGHVKDFIFDDESWAIRYLVVDTRNWWPGGKKVLIATHWISDISWSEHTVTTKLTREEVKGSPEYDEDVVLDRGYEERLHQAYGKRGYWDFE